MNWVVLFAQRLSLFRFAPGFLLHSHPFQQRRHLGGKRGLLRKPAARCAQGIAGRLQLPGVNLGHGQAPVCQGEIRIARHCLLEHGKSLVVPAQPAQGSAEIQIGVCKRGIDRDFLAEVLRRLRIVASRESDEPELVTDDRQGGVKLSGLLVLCLGLGIVVAG